MIYKTKRFSNTTQVPVGIKKIWDDIEKKERDLLKKYNLTPDDWFDDIWVRYEDYEPGYTFFRKPPTREIPEDLIRIGGLGVQGDLDIFYSPSEDSYYTGGEYSDGPDPLPFKTTKEGLKRQMIFALEKDLEILEDCQEDDAIKFQRVNIQMVKSLKF